MSNQELDDSNKGYPGLQVRIKKDENGNADEKLNEIVRKYLVNWQCATESYSGLMGVTARIPSWIQKIDTDLCCPKFSDKEMNFINERILNEKIIPTLKYVPEEFFNATQSVWWVIPFSIWKGDVASWLFINKNGVYAPHPDDEDVTHIFPWDRIQSLDYYSEDRYTDEEEVHSIDLVYDTGELTLVEFVPKGRGSYLSVVKSIYEIRKKTIEASAGERIWAEGAGDEGFKGFDTPIDLLSEKKWENPFMPGSFFTQNKVEEKTAQFYIEQGEEKFESKDYQGAIEDFNNAIAIDPKDDNLYSKRGNAKKELEDYQGAIEDFTKVIEFNTENRALYYTYRGQVKSYLKNYQGAIEDFSKAIEINPNYAFAYYNRGKINNKIENKIGALEDYNYAIKIGKPWAIWYKERSVIKELLGDIEGSKQDIALFESQDARTLESFNNILIKDFIDLREHAKSSSNNWIKESLIANAPFWDKAWEKFTKNEDALIRSAVALNRFISIDRLSELLEDNDIQVKLSALKNTACTEDVLKKASEDKTSYYSSRVRKAVALNSNTQSEIIKKLLKDEYRWVRKAAAAHPFIKNDEITELINSGDRYILKGLAVNPNCIKTDQDKINILLEDKNKYPVEYDKYRLEYKGSIGLVEKIAGEVSIDNLVEAIISEHDSWYEFAYNEFYSWDDLWHEYGPTDHADSVIYPDGTSDMLIFDDIKEDSYFEIGEKNSGLALFTHEAISSESGSWDWKEFKLEYEFNSEYLNFNSGSGYGLIEWYSYENHEEGEDYCDIVGEVGNGYGKGVDIMLYVNTSEEGLQEMEDFIDLREQMEKEGVDLKDKGAIKAFLINKYRLKGDSDTENADSLEKETIVKQEATLQDQLAKEWLKLYPNAEVKKINASAHLDIHMPNIYPKKGTHIWFNTPNKGGFKVGFYCRDKEFIEKIVENNIKNLEPKSNGIRLLGHPTFDNVSETIKAGQDFVKMLGV